MHAFALLRWRLRAAVVSDTDIPGVQGASEFAVSREKYTSLSQLAPGRSSVPASKQHRDARQSASEVGMAAFANAIAGDKARRHVAAERQVHPAYAREREAGIHHHDSRSAAAGRQ